MGIHSLPPGVTRVLIPYCVSVHHGLDGDGDSSHNQRLTTRATFLLQLPLQQSHHVALPVSHSTLFSNHIRSCCHYNDLIAPLRTHFLQPARFR